MKVSTLSYILVEEMSVIMILGVFAGDPFCEIICCGCLTNQIEEKLDFFTKETLSWLVILAIGEILNEFGHAYCRGLRLEDIAQKLIKKGHIIIEKCLNSILKILRLNPHSKQFLQNSLYPNPANFLHTPRPEPLKLIFT